MLYVAKKPLPLRIDEELLRRVDVARGDVPRTRFVERALEAALGGRGPETPRGSALSVEGSGSVKETAPTESPAPPQKPGVLWGRCMKAGCLQVGPVGESCSLHPNMRFKQ
jgi:hypothetical protein